MNKNITIENILKTYPLSKARSDRLNTPYSYYVLKGVSLRLVPIFLRFGLRPNQVTAIAFLILFLAFTAMVCGNLSKWAFLLGGVLINVVLILDNIDGYIARFNKQTTKLGKFLDTLLTWVHYALLPVFLGFGLFIAGPEWWVLKSNIIVPIWIWPVTGFVRSICYLFTIPLGSESKALLNGHGYDKRIKNVNTLILVKALVELEALFLVLGSIFSLVGIIHLIYFTLHVLIFVYVLIKNIYDLKAAV